MVVGHNKLQAISYKQQVMTIKQGLLSAYQIRHALLRCLIPQLVMLQ